ncbi:class I SAM-dependent methyltransferase [Thermodesulfobacteriota bacterium]
MKRANLFHPRVFSDKEWAEGYYKRNAKNIERAGKRFVQLLKISGFENGRILDTGCGFGAVVIEIAKSFDDVEIVGIDLGKPLLKLGELLAEKSRVAGKIYFTEGDVQKLDFEADSFDAVINTFMLHVVDNPVLMLNEIERVAKEQGRIMITDLRRNWLGFVIKKLTTAFTLEEGKEVINNSKIRSGRYAKGPFWWDYMVGV